MNTFIAFFRGINVGGNNILPMKELITILEAKGYVNVKTYIQSGNVVFQTDKDKAEIAKEMSVSVKQSYGFEPNVLILGRAELEVAIENNPFSTENGKVLHFFFLSEKPQNPDMENMNKLKTQSESFKLIEKVFYLHAPDGIGRSKLAAKVEKIMQVPVTARNWNTVSKVINML